MCTVVIRSLPGEPVRLLALRDELTGRPFDDPGHWWPEQPTVVGGRDRTAGGSWCVTEVASGVTGCVLNRPERRIAAAGAPSRGVLPLLAVQHGEAWPEQLATRGMASFTLLLIASGTVRRWIWDGFELSRDTLPSGTSMVTSGGAEDGKADRHLADFETAEFPAGWARLVQAEPPSPDAAALVVRHELNDLVFATVFGQLIEAGPGSLDVQFSRTPWLPGWQRATWS